MKRYALFIIVALLLLLSAAYWLNHLTRAQAQANEKSAPPARPPSTTQEPGDTAPDARIRTVSDRATAPQETPRPALQCQGCHGAGKTLPYLGGAVHFYEAVLATLAIIVWHFYQVIFDPDVYPVNFAFIDGRVSEDFYKEEHELAYEKMKEQAAQDEVKTAEPTLDERPAD